MELQDQVKLHKEICEKIDELESQKKDLSIAIMQQMTDKVMTLPAFVLRRYNRLSIKLTIEQARALSAVKMEETVDKDKVKILYNNGEQISGVSETQYIQISTKEKEHSLI